MDWGLIVLRFLHIAGGAAWLGASIFANLVVVPYLGREPADRRPALVRGLVLAPERVIIASALTAGVSGLVLGVVGRGFGVTVSLTTPAGLVWLAAIGVTFAVFAVGGRITSPAARQLRDASVAGLESAVARLRLGFRLELAGIVAILALMVLLPRV